MSFPGRSPLMRLRLAGPRPHAPGLEPFLLTAQLALIVAASVATAYLLVRSGDWRIAFGLFALAGFVGLGLVRPAAFLSLFLLVRPVLDSATESKLGPLNVSGALGLVAVGVLGALIVTSGRIHRPAATLPFAVVLVLSAFACVPAFANFGGEIGSKPIGELARLTALFGVYLLAANLVLSAERLKALFVVIGVSAVVPAIMGLDELIRGGEAASGLEVQRITGPFTGPNAFGVFLAVTGLVLLSLPRRTVPMWLRAPSVALILVALVGTYSRAGWALFVIGFVLLGWRERRGLVVAGAVAITALVLLVPPVHDRVLPPKESATASGRAITPESYRFRLDTWAGLLEKWAERPLVGYGLETTGQVNPRRVATAPGESTGYDAHNSVVKLLVEGGVLLLAAYAALLIMIFRKLGRMARSQWSGRLLAQALLSIWTATLVIGLATDDPLGATATMYCLLALTGALEGSFLRARSRRAEPAAA